MMEMNQALSFQSRVIYRFLKVFFYLLYNQFAWTYDWIAGIVSLGKWKDWVLAILPYIQDGPILEIGHGPGHLLVQLEKHNFEVIGLDLSQWMGCVALRNARKNGCFLMLVNGYAQSMPFPDRVFHQVVATFPSEYILDPISLEEIWRVLYPGGTLVIIPVAWITGYRWFERMAAWLFRFTGQAAKWDDFQFEPFRQVGFKLQTERQILNSSELLVLIAHKPDEPDINKIKKQQTLNKEKQVKSTSPWN